MVTQCLSTCKCTVALEEQLCKPCSDHGTAALCGQELALVTVSLEA